MSIYKSSNEIGKLYVGNNQIGKVYKGSELIYTAETPLYTYGVQDVAWIGTGGGYGSGSVTFTDDYVELKSTGNYGNGPRRQAMFTSAKIDLSNYDIIKVLVSGYDGYLRYTANDGFVLGVTNSIDANFFNTAIAKTNLNPATKTDEIREVIMDISNLEGEYYIGIGLFAYKMYDKTDTVKVYSVILE